ncbi:ATP-binding cassette domain-containing protein [Zhouia amylolytica]|uniref:ABC transporter ATP-binding protein n=1 Tax=Zhouia amylolytica AD3 TaxID=1286632 RepID=W2UKJ5_9FLAO|nr:ATP-binding cassette domain-containing protein [Zhouia amylolytica]ETN94523.1 ABC transporter ATP-binding protein [Zhouia amylolytica AD3]
MKLRIEGLNKSYGNNGIISNLSVQCEKGEIVSVFGRNGCGKSTLLKIIFGSLKADQMTLTIDEKEINPKKSRSSQLIGYLPQSSFLPKELNVRNLIPMCYRGDEQDKIFYAPRVSTFENKKIGYLSQGEVRYLESLIVGNLKHPFLLLDEPFSMIEPLYKELIKEFYLNIKPNKGIIITDHNYNDVLEISNRSFLLQKGHKIAINDKNCLKENGYLTSSDYN